MVAACVSHPQMMQALQLNMSKCWNNFPSKELAAAGCSVIKAFADVWRTSQLLGGLIILNHFY